MHNDMTVDWGLDPERIAALLAPVRRRSARASGGSESPHPGLDELFARVLWSVVVEPGDSVAGILVQARGPVAAARLLISRPSPGGVGDAVRAGRA